MIERSKYHGKETQRDSRSVLFLEACPGNYAAKQRIARATGIPTTKAGRQQKIGRMLTGGGCLFPVLSLIALAALLFVAVFG